MEVIDFRKITIEDIHDDQFNDGSAWSRIYEYPLVLDWIEKLYKPGNIVHNSSWGFQGVHVTFKESLDKKFNCLHSDIRTSNLKNTFYYDITQKPESKEMEKYDFVINISTLEEVNCDHLEVFSNLMMQLKRGGFFIATFDLPGLQIEKFENLFSRKLQKSSSAISGVNSKLINSNYADLNCGIMVVKK